MLEQWVEQRVEVDRLVVADLVGSLADLVADNLVADNLVVGCIGNLVAVADLVESSSVADFARSWAVVNCMGLTF